GGGVGAHDDHVVAAVEQGGGGAEKSRGCARSDNDVVGANAVAAGRDRLAQHGVAEVVAVAEQQIIQLELQSQISQPSVGDRALGEVVGDGVVAQLLRRLDLDR